MRSTDTATRRLAVILALILAAGPAAADEAPWGDAGCAPIGTGEAIIAGAADGLALRLADGRTLRLAGIDLPPVALSRPDPPAWKEAQAMLGALEGAAVRFDAASKDRHGRIVAHAHLASAAGGEPWIQARLVGAGLAIVAATAGSRDCLGRLLGTEREAREARLGVWRDDHDIRRAATDPSLAGIDGLYQLVEGRLLSIGRRPYMVFLDFGRDWATDFTVSLAAATAAALEAEAGSLDALEGRMLRVRGWVTQRGGPTIRVDHPEQIEVLDR